MEKRPSTEALCRAFVEGFSFLIPKNMKGGKVLEVTDQMIVVAEDLERAGKLK